VPTRTTPVGSGTITSVSSVHDELAPLVKPPPNVIEAARNMSPRFAASGQGVTSPDEEMATPPRAITPGTPGPLSGRGRKGARIEQRDARQREVDRHGGDPVEQDDRRVRVGERPRRKGRVPGADGQRESSGPKQSPRRRSHRRRTLLC